MCPPARIKRRNRFDRPTLTGRCRVIDGEAEGGVHRLVVAVRGPYDDIISAGGGARRNRARQCTLRVDAETGAALNAVAQRAVAVQVVEEGIK